MNLDTYLINEPGIYKDLLNFFSKDDDIVIFDIGSCEGEDSIRYSQTFPNSKIYAFEPLSKNFSKLKINLEKYKTTNVECYECAMSNTVGNVDFYVSEGQPDYLEKSDDWDYGNKSSSIFEPKNHQPEWMSFNKTINILSNTIYNFCQEKNINSIDFIHMDVQGAEKIVLEGAGDLLKNIKFIWLEVSLVEFYKNQPLKNEMINFLNKNGFYVVKDVCSHMSGDILVKNIRF